MSELLKVFAFTADQAQRLAGQSVAGEPVTVGGATIIPISKLSCGFAGGGSDLANRGRADAVSAGAGVKVTRTPLFFLAIVDGQVQVLRADSGKVEKDGLANALLPLIDQLRARSKKEKNEALPEDAHTEA